LANPKYAHYLYTTKSSVVLVNKDFKLEQNITTTLIRVDNAYEAIARLLTAYESMKPKRTGVHSLAYVAESAKIGKDCYIAPFAYVGDNAVIGDNTQIYTHTVVEAGAHVGSDCILYPNVSVYHDCKIGNRVILHSGCVIGADGFGFAPSEEGYEKIPQIGIVTIEDDVEIGANTCVDRSTMGSTYVRKGTKLDNLVQIAHNVDVGSNTVMSAQVGVAGSTKIGEWCMFGGQVGITGHATIANRTMTGAQAGIAGSVRKEGLTLQGSPAIDAKNFMRSSAVFKNLPDMYREMNAIKKELEDMKARLEAGKNK
jgi:UDP-3-O-[3-hydroxymyristoyl] glucosamine N-acyltransferase